MADWRWPSPIPMHSDLMIIPFKRSGGCVPFPEDSIDFPRERLCNRCWAESLAVSDRPLESRVLSGYASPETLVFPLFPCVVAGATTGYLRTPSRPGFLL